MRTQQEDFVHPIAAIELLWRSCCASESEKEESSLSTRLKVRQWTQMLVDHSLLLGSSEGVYLHDIVLHYLRKRLTAAEMRAEQTKVGDKSLVDTAERDISLSRVLSFALAQVVDGMVAASQARTAATGRGLQDTGSTARAVAGEEVDW